MGQLHAHQSCTAVYRQSLTAMAQAFSRAPTYFLRDRKLGPLQVLLTMQAAHCGGPSCGAQSWEDALASLAATCDGDPEWGKRFAVSCAAFHKAVKKVSVEDQDKLWEMCLEIFPSGLGSKLVELHGKRFAHVDGSQVRVPRSDELVKVVGLQTNGPNASSHYPSAKSVLVLEAGTQRILGHELCRCKAVGKDQTSVLAREERGGWRRLRDKTLENHAIIADSGFASHEDFVEMNAHGKDFIIAIPKAWKIVRAFRNMKKSDAVISIPLPRDAKRTLTLRIFTIKDGEGKVRYIATNLKDPFTLSDLRRLYKTRWSIEIWFRYAKEFLAMRRLRSRTLHGVRIEMLAILTLMQAVAALRTRISQQCNTIKDILCSLKNGFRKAKFRSALKATWILTRTALVEPEKKEPCQMFIRLISKLFLYRPRRRYPRVSHDPSGAYVAKRPSRTERKHMKNKGIAP